MVGINFARARHADTVAMAKDATKSSERLVKYIKARGDVKPGLQVLQAGVRSGVYSRNRQILSGYNSGDLRQVKTKPLDFSVFAKL